MNSSWQELLSLIGKRIFRVERIRLKESGITIKGDFVPPPLCCLSPDDQAFVTAFVACHGSIKRMEELFGVSYPTVKNRLNAIADQLDVPRVDINPYPKRRSEVLDRLDRREISFEEAMEALK